jgi:hypothetical protein
VFPIFPGVSQGNPQKPIAVETGAIVVEFKEVDNAAKSQKVMAIVNHQQTVPKANSALPIVDIPMARKVQERDRMLTNKQLFVIIALFLAFLGATELERLQKPAMPIIKIQTARIGN